MSERPEVRIAAQTGTTVEIVLKELEAALAYRAEDIAECDPHDEHEAASIAIYQAARAFSQIAPLLKEMMEKREKVLGDEFSYQDSWPDGTKYWLIQSRHIEPTDLPCPELRGVCKVYDVRDRDFIICAANTATAIGRILK